MIAVVDDDSAVREALCNLLDSVGHGNMSFGSAEELLGSTKKLSLRCMIVDVRMSGMTGLEMQNVLRQQGSTTPLIFLTAHCDEVTRERAFAGGALAFHCKPFDEDELLGSIEDALRQPMTNL